MIRSGQTQGFNTKAPCHLPKVATEEETESDNTSQENFGVKIENLHLDGKACL